MTDRAFIRRRHGIDRRRDVDRSGLDIDRAAVCDSRADNGPSSKPADDASSMVMLGKTDELIFMGKEQDGFVSVETSKGSGWVKKVLISK